MAVYWMMFLLPLWGTISLDRASHELKNLIILVFFVIFTILIGFRYEVGGDWNAYMVYLEDALYSETQTSRIITSDFFYEMLNVYANKFNYGIEFVNFVCALILVSGITLFCSQQKTFFLSFLITVPYLQEVIGMGYTRQSAAIGLSLIAISFLMKNKSYLFFIFLFLAFFFHKSSIILVPFGVFELARKRQVLLLFGFLISLFAGLVFVFDILLTYANNYMYNRSGDSRGALVRILMSACASVFLLRYHKKLFDENDIRWFWLSFSLLPLLALPLISIASTLADRLTLYSIPLQIFVYTRLHLLFTEKRNKNFIYFSVISVYAISHYIWLNHSFHSTWWIPYQTKIFFW